jgi:hypothetical protein
MRLFVAFVMFVMSGCFAASTSLHSGGMTFEASGLNAPTPMEAASADLTSAQADRVRAEARTMEAHPELFMGRGGYGYSGYYGYQGGFGYGGARVDPNYYYAPYGYGASSASTPALEEQATELEQEAGHLETLLREHIEEEGR